MSNTYDAIVVGAGFGGAYELYQLRKMGISVKGFEKGSQLGGVWYWNRYPGARVDSEVPYYQLFLKEVYSDWTFSERFPGQAELLQYFHHLDSKIHISKDYAFNTVVSKAHYDKSDDRWEVTTVGEGAGVYRARFLLLCTGFAAKKYVPNFKNLGSFKGPCFHTADWPEQGIDLKGKRVGVIGTGASGVQVIQEIGPIVKELTVFQRTPNIAIPMVQWEASAKEQNEKKPGYEDVFKGVSKSMGGFYFNPDPRSAVEVTPEERKAHYDYCFKKGGFHFWVGTFHDVWTNKEADATAYDYWKTRVRARLTREDMKEKLAPTVALHPFVAKRPCLEQTYFEVFNQPNVEVVSIGEEPIEEITEKGVKTSKQEVELDVLVLATGFDALTGGLLQIDLRGIDGQSLKDSWEHSTHTYLGMTIDGFPNSYFLYGPQGPTAFCNGPSCAQIQGDWINKAIKYTVDNGYTCMNPKKEAAEKWSQHVTDLANLTLVPGTRSWYMGSNIPGKKVEALNYLGGLPNYCVEIGEEIANGYPGFSFS